MSAKSSLPGTFLMPAWTPARRKPRGTWMVIVLQQGCGLGISKHQIKILHGCAGSPFDQVVLGTDQQQPPFHDARRDVHEVGVGRVLSRRQLLDDFDKWL